MDNLFIFILYIFTQKNRLYNATDVSMYRFRKILRVVRFLIAGLSLAMICILWHSFTISLQQLSFLNKIRQYRCLPFSLSLYPFFIPGSFITCSFGADIYLRCLYILHCDYDHYAMHTSHDSQYNLQFSFASLLKLGKTFPNFLSVIIDPQSK